MPITALLVIHVVWKLTAQITYNLSPAWIQVVTALGLHKIQIPQTAQLLTASSQKTFSGGFDLSPSLDDLPWTPLGDLVPETI